MILLILTLILPRTISPGEMIHESSEASYAYGGIRDAGYQQAFRIDATDRRMRYVFYVTIDNDGRGTLRTAEDNCYTMQNIGLEQQVFLTPRKGGE